MKIGEYYTDELEIWVLLCVYIYIKNLITRVQVDLFCYTLFKNPG